MATFTLGKVSINPRGSYSSSTAYATLDLVSNRGGSYLCIVANSGIEPGGASNWATYWMSLSKGITSLEITSPETGKATISIVFSDGTSTSATIDTSAIGDGAIGTNNLAPKSVTKDKLASGATYTQIAVILTVAGWSNNSQTVTVSGVTANNAVIVSPAPGSYLSYGEFGVYCNAQTTNSLTFVCDSAPDVALTVNVLIPV